MKSTLFSIVFLCTVLIGFSQEFESSGSSGISKTLYKHSLGASIGSTTGMGLSYRFWPSRFGFQVTGMPVMLAEHETSFTVGATLLYKWVDAQTTSFYSYLGNSYRYQDYTYGFRSRFEQLNTGLGIGIEFVILKRVSFNIMGGFAGYDSFDRIGVAGETGLFYRF